jgi:hypothetical protein
MPPEQRLEVIKQRIVGKFGDYLENTDWLDAASQELLDWRSHGINIAVGYAVYDSMQHHDASAVIEEADNHMRRHKSEQHDQYGAYRPV